MRDRALTVTVGASPAAGGRFYVRFVSERRSLPLDRFAAVGLLRPDAGCGDSRVLMDCHLHSDDDAICPRCLTWIEERQFVRLTAYGLLQHEVCPRRED
ncbi:MAG: hypothetical protein JWM02_103 [Frankiales bacterium]|nr:hypothetical protein [Frankiales bacterium]